MSRYGRKGGDGPTAGRKKATFTALAPDGTLLKKGSFFGPEMEIELGGQGVAALLGPSKGHPNWEFWVVAPTEELMPDWVKRGAGPDKLPATYVPARRVK